MIDAVSELKAYVSGQLRTNCDPVPPKTATSRTVHLSVWMTRGRGRAIGVELGHKSRVNLWVVSMYAPKDLPATVDVSRKVWKGLAWQDKDPDPARTGRDGANSNLKSYDEFRTKPITCLGIKSIEDARAIFEHLFA